MVAVRVFLLVMLFAGSGLATDQTENSFRVVVKIADQSCTIAASDSIRLGQIRRLVTALDSYGQTNIRISASEPVELVPSGQFVDLRWSNDREARVRATGETKHGVISTMTDALVGTERVRVTVSVIEPASEALAPRSNRGKSTKPNNGD
ncbi:MAG: hypothetical protein ACE361_16015 [Aureliella sp.]